MFKALDLGAWRKGIGRILLRFSKCSLHKLFILDTNSKGTRGHTCKLVKTRCTRDITKYFFQVRWNLLDQRTVDAPSINAFKSRLCYIRDNRMGFFVD